MYVHIYKTTFVYVISTYESSYVYIHIFRIEYRVYGGGGGGIVEKGLILFCEPHPPPLLISGTKTTFPVGVVVILFGGI